MCAPGWHGTHRYDIPVLATHTSTWVHRYSSLLLWSLPLGQRDHVAMVGRILCTKCTLHSNHRLTRVIFQHTKPLLPRSGHVLITYTRIAEMWTTMKNNSVGKTFLSCSFYLYRFREYMSYCFPIINFCIPEVHYETTCRTAMLTYLYIPIKNVCKKPNSTKLC